MLRTIRLTLAIVFFALVTLLFLDFTGTLHGWMGWMAKIQFLPALLALIIRKSKCSRISKRKVHFTKRKV